MLVLPYYLEIHDHRTQVLVQPLRDWTKVGVEKKPQTPMAGSGINKLWTSGSNVPYSTAPLGALGLLVGVDIS